MSLPKALLVYKRVEYRSDINYDLLKISFSNKFPDEHALGTVG